MSNVISMKALLESGVHFGHRTNKWNPGMRPYIFTERNGIHIIDLQQTAKSLNTAYALVRDAVQSGQEIMFIGTKRQAQETIRDEAIRCGMPYVTERWLGGTLTNFRTIRKRMSRLEELETLLNGEEINLYSKKMQSALNREYRKVYHNLNGLRLLNRLPEVIVLIDPRKEKNAVAEAHKLGISTVALIDTDCDPDEVDLVIPGNDDSIRSIELIMTKLADAVLEGKAIKSAQNEGKDE